MIGQVLNGNYRLTDLVGSGGYADVYLARDLRSNTIVAVKILHSHVARDPDIAARFEREASLARRLQTPHIARILDAGQDPTSPPFMVMEFVQGLTVAELIRRHGPFSIPEAVQIVDQLLIALGSAHALGIVHRDVKPQNLMIDAERRLKVLDFGVARVAGAGTMTSSGHLLGTPEYMAAEQVDGRAIDFRVDLYAAGAVLYQLLSGRAPYLRYADTDLWELVRRVRSEMPPSIRQLRPEVSPALAAVVERAMAKDANQRYQSAYEMRQALAAASGTGDPTPLPPPGSAPSPGETQILGALPDLLAPRPVPPGQPPPVGQSPPGQQAAGPPPTRPYPPGQSPPGQRPPGQSPPAAEYPPSAPPTRPYQPSQTPQGQYAPGPVSPGLSGPGQYPPSPYPPGPYPPRPAPPQGFTPPPPMPPGPGSMPGPGTGRRSGMPAWQIVGLGVGALVLVIVGVALGRMVPLPGSSSSPTTTPTTAPGKPTQAPATTVPSTAQAASKPTASPAPVAKPTSSPSPVVAVKPTTPPTAPPKPTNPPPSPTAPPKPTAPPNPPGVLAADNFENAEIGQFPRVSGRPNDYTYSYDRGEYVINKVNPAMSGAPIVFVPGGPYENSAIAIDVRMVGDAANRYAFVVCRDQTVGGQAKQYRASLVPAERGLILSRWDTGRQRVLAEVRDEAAINAGNATNRLELRCAGAKISAVVNGKMVASVDDMTLNKGEHGVGAGTFDQINLTLEARFDNLEVRVP